MTPFCFEHVFRAPSIEAVIAAYFDPDQLSSQDRAVDIVERQVLELVDDGETLRRVTRIVPRRKVPALVRPFITLPLHYLETVTWRRKDDEIDITIRPSILKGRAVISAMYRLSRLSDGAIRRRYEGSVSVDIALLSSRIERGIVAEFERSMPVAAGATQAWLDRCEADQSAIPSTRT
jgi:hypothetical protein